MRTLNVKRTVLLLVVVIVIAGSTHLLHSFQIQRYSSTFKNQARAAWNDNPRRILDALQTMSAYSRMEPKDYDARQELGFWLAESGQFGGASATLEEIIRLREKENPPDLPKIQEARRKLIDIALEQKRLVDAVKYLEILKRELPDDVDVLNLLGKCQITLKREDQAIENLTTAIKLRPDRVDFYYGKALTLLNPPLKNPVAAEKCMAEMIAFPANAKSAGAHHLYGKWLQQYMGRHEEALKQAELTLELEKDHPGGLYLAAQAELALRHYPSAEKYAQRGMTAAPQDYAMYALMAEIKIQSNEKDKAIEVLKQGAENLQSASDKAQLLWHLANLYLDNKQDAKSIVAAVECIRRMREYHYPAMQIAFLEARVQYDNDNWKAAREGFESVRPKLSDFPPLMKCLDYWVGDCYLQQGNPEQAMIAFRAALSSDKLYFNARDGIAQIFLTDGKLKEAVEEYRQAAVSNLADAEAWLAYARTLLLANLRRSGEEQKENWNDVRRALQRAQALNPRNAQVTMMTADFLFAEGRQLRAEGKLPLAEEKQQHAEDLLRELREGSPAVAEFWVAQVNMAMRRGALDRAKKILDEARTKLGDKVPLRLAQVQFLLAEPGPQAVAELEKLAANIDDFSPREKIYLWGGLLNYFTEIKEYDRAKQLCRQIAKLQPHDAKIRYRVLELALLTYDARDPAASLAEVDRVLDEIDAIAGQGPLWLYGKAVRLKLEAAQGSPEQKAKLLDEAMRYADKAQKQRRSWSRPAVLRGEICRQRGQDEKALEYYLQASINGDRDLSFTRLLLQMLYERQRYQEAEQVIHRLDSEQTPLSHDILTKEAEIFVVEGDFERALELAKSAYDPNSDDYHDHLWHGQVLKLLYRRAQQEGHPEKLPDIAQSAEKSLRRSCQLAPNAPDCRVALVQLLVATDQRSAADVAADDARQMIPVDVSPLAMAYIYEALGNTEKAGQCYEKALSLRPDSATTLRLLAEFYVRNRDFHHATPLIERLLGGQEQGFDSNLIVARRLKAQVLLATEGYPKLKEATELVDQNLASPQASGVDKRLKIRLLLADPGQARSSEVLRLAESLVLTGGSEPEAEDRFQLARIYLARGEWDRYHDQMEKLVNGSQASPRHLTEYVRMLLEHNQLNDAELSLDRLGRVSKSTDLVALRAELMFRNKRWGEVPGFLAAYVGDDKPQGKAEPNDYLARVLLAAQLLEDLGGRLTAPAQREIARSYLEQAGHWYEIYGQKHKQGKMTLAGFYARRGKLPAALDLLTRFGASASPPDLAAAAVTIARSEGITPQQLQQVERLLNDVATAQQQPIPVLNALAVVKISQGNYAAAEDVYRQVIAKASGDYLAYNNLGILLALAGNKLDEALATINRAIELAGPQPFLLDSRAVVHMARNEAQQALEDMDSITADKLDPIGLFHKARALYMVGKTDEARDLFHKACNEKDLNRAKVDPPERPFFEQLLKDLAEPVQ